MRLGNGSENRLVGTHRSACALPLQICSVGDGELRLGGGGSYKRIGARRPVMKCWVAEPFRGLTGVLAHFRYKFARRVMGILRLGGGGSYKRIGARRPVMKCWDAEPIRGLTGVLAHFRYKFARREMGR